MFETETARLLEMRLAARGQPVLTAQIDHALWVIARLADAEDDGELDELEVAIEALAGMVGALGTRH